jgi:hypothetical protein
MFGKKKPAVVEPVVGVAEVKVTGDKLSPPLPPPPLPPQPVTVEDAFATMPTSAVLAECYKVQLAVLDELKRLNEQVQKQNA